MEYPLELAFKIIAIAPQVWVRDATGRLLFYVKQKAFKLKESVTVFADEAKTREVVRISADRVIDISAVYSFEDPSGNRFGGLRGKGIRSFWKARYDIFGGAGEEVVLTIHEDNPFVKLMDGILLQIPVLGMLSGYLFHPSYTVARPDGRPLMRVKKRPAFLESRYGIEKLAEPEQTEALLGVLGILMMVLLERRRG